jgi:flagellar motility protein MotE (MotC chaperone)
MHVNQSGRVTLMGENADIDLNGKSLKTWMERVEERLNILTPNAELEKEWDELRRLGERYRKLEKKCKEKAEMWNKLKSMPAVKTPK